ncbi:hypothetical protein E2542_SST13387 [Spatholobus suberectus]|nr:hypothetical protein E2542_SST13387 [Spatholobus suberectus]
MLLHLRNFSEDGWCAKDIILTSLSQLRSATMNYKMLTRDYFPGFVRRAEAEDGSAQAGNQAGEEDSHKCGCATPSKWQAMEGCVCISLFMASPSTFLENLVTSPDALRTNISLSKSLHAK